MNGFAFDPGHHDQDIFDVGIPHQDSLTGYHHADGSFDSSWDLMLGEHQPGPFDISHFLELGAIGQLWEMLHTGNFPNLDQLSHTLGFAPIGSLLEMLHPDHPSEHSSSIALSLAGPNYNHFRPESDIYGIIGDPKADIASWHQQSYPDTCAIVSQEFIIESLTGHHVSEDTLVHEAMNYGWYTPGGGTPRDYVGALLEVYGIHVQHEQRASLADVIDKLNQHQKVIVGLNAEDIWYEGGPNDPIISYPGIPGQQADHAVEVIGINNADPANPLVILNDPGMPDGNGIEIPVTLFDQAWSASNYYMVATTDASQPSRDDEMGYVPSLGGYYNVDGTYHYDSDNTDRDPQTGVIGCRYRKDRSR